MSTQPGHTFRDLLAICAAVFIAACVVAMVLAARLNT